MEPVNTAVVGCGIFGQVHVETYARFPGSRLVAVCDLDAGRAQRTAEKHACRAVTDVEEIAADPSIRAVSVATPDFAHAEPCITLAKAGKHILVEKPLATSVADAEAIAAAVRQAGVIGMMDFHNRYNPALATVKARLESGRIGRPQMLYARLSDRLEVATKWFSWAARTGPEWFLGSHLVDVACWLFGQAPRRVFAEGRKEVLAGRGIDCYDSMQMHLSFPAGMATLETSWIVPDSWPMVVNFVVNLQATAGRADVDLGRQGLTVSGPDGFEWPLLFGNTTVGPERFGFFSFPIHDFLRAVQSGGPAPVGIEEGVRNVKIVAAAVRSAQTGQVIDLES